jgi:hypothetical protein
MFICIIYPISEYISKKGTLTTSVFGSNASATECIGYDALFERKIEDITLGLGHYYYRKLLSRVSQENAMTIAKYIISIRTEMNPTDNYRGDAIKGVAKFSIFCNNKSSYSWTSGNNSWCLIIHVKSEIFPLVNEYLIKFEPSNF